MTRRPNIVLIVLDALRASHVSAYGYPRRTTPALDRFADQAALFRRAISPATWTVPAHASLLTGLNVSQHRVESIESDRRFHESIVTLPEALASSGYHCAAFSQNMLFGPDNHLDQGFDEFRDVDGILESNWLSKQILRHSDGPPGPRRLFARYLRKMIAPRKLLGAMGQWIETQERETPFFLMANVLEPHFPWTVPPGLLLREVGFHPSWLLKPDYVTLKNQWKFNSGKLAVTDKHRHIWRKLYDAALRHADREVGRFLDRLRRWPQWDNTIVIVTADHGEMLGDYRNLVGHLLCLHDHLIHVPLMIRHPDYSQPRQVEGVVQTHDLYPSILEWSGCPTRDIPAAQLSRPPLSRALADPSARGGFAISEEDYTDSYDVLGKLRQANPALDCDQFPSQQIAVRSATHKYIWRNDGRSEFYDLVADPGEEQNLSATGDPVQQEAMRLHEEELERWRSAREIFPPIFSQSGAEMDEAVVGRLRALGYVL